MKTPTVWFLAALVVPFLVAGAAERSAAAEVERILDFESRIRVHAHGGMTVTETIEVVSAGNRIKRGIFRDFPTTYRDRLGNTVRVGFDIVEILRDNRPEPYNVRDYANGKRIYIGDKDIFLGALSCPPAERAAFL